MSKTEEQKLIIDGKEYVGDDITPQILMGAIQALKMDMDNRFKKLATSINKESAHIDQLDGVVQEHQATIGLFNKNFEALQKLMIQNSPKGENNEKE